MVGFGDDGEELLGGRGAGVFEWGGGLERVVEVLVVGDRVVATGEQEDLFPESLGS